MIYKASKGMGLSSIKWNHQRWEPNLNFEILENFKMTCILLKPQFQWDVVYWYNVPGY
jgi:hypothetical protein